MFSRSIDAYGYCYFIPENAPVDFTNADARCKAWDSEAHLAELPDLALTAQLTDLVRLGVKIGSGLGFMLLSLDLQKPVRIFGQYFYAMLQYTVIGSLIWLIN